MNHICAGHPSSSLKQACELKQLVTLLMRTPVAWSVRRWPSDLFGLLWIASERALREFPIRGWPEGTLVSIQRKSLVLLFDACLTGSNLIVYHSFSQRRARSFFRSWCGWNRNYALAQTEYDNFKFQKTSWYYLLNTLYTAAFNIVIKKEVCRSVIDLKLSSLMHFPNIILMRTAIFNWKSHRDCQILLVDKCDLKDNELRITW